MARATIPKIPWGTASASGESLGSGDGVKVTFSGTLAKPELWKKSLTITAGAQSVSDDGAGNLTGSGSGTINYATGAYSVTFNAAPATGTAVTAAYTHYPHTLNVELPPDQATGFGDPRDGSEWAQAPSGARDSWIVGTDERLAGTVRWIPTTDSADPLATGWDGAAGWAAFLKWARDTNVFRFYPDRDSATYVDCYLVEPLRGEPPLEEDGSRQLRIVIESVDGTPFTGY